MIFWIAAIGSLVGGALGMAAVWLIHRRRRRVHGNVYRNPNQKVRTPAAVRRARAPQRRAYMAHRRGRRRFR